LKSKWASSPCTQLDAAVEDETDSAGLDGPAIDRSHDACEQPKGDEILSPHSRIADIHADRCRRNQMRPVCTAARSRLEVPRQHGRDAIVFAKIASE
jgi:hypothetical protein